MYSHPSPSRPAPVPRWPAASPRRFDIAEPLPLDAVREAWMGAFIGRLAELQPLEDEDVLVALAADLYVDVGRHDPVIAAEMEHEANFGFD